MIPSQDCRSLIEGFEGLRLTAYRDIAGVLTIGYGHTGTDVHLGMTITTAQADALLATDLTHFSTGVDGLVHDVATSQKQFDAMVSFAYNLGVGALKSSSVLSLHRAGEIPAAAAAFLLWDKAHVDGSLVEVPGLLRRRMAERDLYLTTVDRVAAVAADPVIPIPAVVANDDTPCNLLCRIGKVIGL